MAWQFSKNRKRIHQSLLYSRRTIGYEHENGENGEEKVEEGERTMVTHAYSAEIRGKEEERIFLSMGVHKKNITQLSTLHSKDERSCSFDTGSKCHRHQLPNPHFTRLPMEFTSTFRTGTLQPIPNTRHISNQRVDRALLGGIVDFVFTTKVVSLDNMHSNFFPEIECVPLGGALRTLR